MNEMVEQVVPGNAQLAIQARNLSKKFIDDYAVQNVSFDIPRGKIFGFIGPSGCGKTTTVRLLTGIYEPTEGTVSVLGRDPRHFSSRARARIGYMPQLFVLYPDLSVWENINFAASLYGLNPFTRQKRLNELLDFVELSAHRDKLVRNTSGGMQRRLSLATALVPNPDLIFLDEPTAGIDPVLRQKFWERFKDLQNNGRTLFITTQYVGEAAYCDFVGVMANGHLLMVESPEDLRKHAFGGEVVDLQASSPISFEKVFAIQDLDFVRGKVHLTGENALRITVDDASRAIPELIEWCKRNGVPVESINEFVPPFDDVFVHIIQHEAEHA